MMKTKKTVESTEYIRTASHAAEQERTGNYGIATLLWGQARKLASSITNYDWADSRMAFCHVRQLRK